MNATLGKRGTAVITLVAASFIAVVGRADPKEPAPEKLAVTIPLANPMKGFDASTVAWNGAAQVFHAFSREIADAASLDRFMTGRLTHVIVSLYLDYAANYYFHELAHCFHSRGDVRHFWLDLGDWTHGVPAVEVCAWRDCWDEQTLDQYVHGHDPEFDTRIRRWIILMGESGLYQNKCNARFAAQLALRTGQTTISNAISFVCNHATDIPYIAFRGREAVTTSSVPGYTLQADNDITRYTSVMRELGITISRDDWLAASIFAFAASGGTWNSARAGYAYLAHGERSVDNLSWRVADQLAVSPPNFYLFPTYRGLYLESETCFHLGSPGGSRVHLVLGTGLDSFGLHQTGPVDWLRIGGRYDAIDVNARLFRLSVSPYCYIDSSRDLKYRGRSIGAELSCPVWKRFGLYGKIEHNRNDMLEGIIKGKDEGIYALATVGFRLGDVDSIE